MRIKKVSQTTPTTAQVVDDYSTSTNDSYSCNYINELDTYSTTEKRVGTWIDGKPLYRKTFIHNNSTTGNVTIDININNLDNCWINSEKSFYKITASNNVTYTTPITFNNNSSYVIAFIHNTNNKIVFNTNDSGWKNGTAYISLEYTKTTD